MGMWKAAKDAYNAELNAAKNPPPRTLTDSDLLGWDEAQRSRLPNKRELKTMQDVRRALFTMHPRRMSRLQADFDWAQKQMLKLDLNPEDLRFLL